MNFYYPVAVGGPVTKTIDQMAADFGKENPDIKVNPIYSGTYQESIVKALTAAKSGKPPQLAVLLSTDMFSLIDEEAIVPIDDIAKIGRRQEVARRLLQELHDEQPHRRQDLGHPVPALDHRPLLEQGGVQGGRPRPGEGPGELGPDGRVREEADQDRRLAATSPSGA